MLSLRRSWRRSASQRTSGASLTRSAGVALRLRSSISRGCRSLCLAAGLGALIWAALFGFSLGSLNTDKERYPSYRYAANQLAEASSTLAGVTHSQPIEYRRPCQNPKGETESDLCAQWKSANAAEDSAFWAQWGFWIAVIGSSFLLWQIMLTRDAVEGTGKATEAMLEANKIAREANRPWLGVVDLQFTRIETTSERIDVQWRAGFTNAGLSPAMDVFPHMQLSVAVFSGDKMIFVTPERSWEETAITLFRKARGHFGEAIIPGATSPIGLYGVGELWNNLLREHAASEDVIVSVEFGVVYAFGDELCVTRTTHNIFDRRRGRMTLPKSKLVVVPPFIESGALRVTKAT